MAATPLSLQPVRPDHAASLPRTLDGRLPDPLQEAMRREQIRLLRTELLLRHEHGAQANMLALLSPCAGEGRSQLAAELAIAFAQLGRPTLLVDADLHRPRQHLIFDADNRQGLGSALVQGRRPALQGVADLPALQLITAGPPCGNAIDLLSDRGFELLVREWQRAYAFVIVDTPPICEFADGLAVAASVGRLLSLSRARHTPLRASQEMLRRLGATRTRIVGAVINHF